MLKSSKNKKDIVTKCGLNISIYTFEVCNKVVYEVVSDLAPANKYMLYIHGGPNLSCEPYISDTSNGGFRSLEPFLRHTNIILVDQREELKTHDCKGEISHKYGSWEAIIKLHGPDGHSDVYKAVIEQCLSKHEYGIFAQSFGTQSLLFLLKKGLHSDCAPRYLVLGSPFLGIDGPEPFVLYRREKLKYRTEELEKAINNSLVFQKVADRAHALGVGNLVKHKLAICISHPAHPTEIIKRSIEQKVYDLNALDDRGLIEYCEDVGPSDLINFIVGSQYFTPGSNIYHATLCAMDKIHYFDWMPDEGAWLKYALEKQYQGTSLLEKHFVPPVEDGKLQSLLDYMRAVPTFVYFDPNDFMIPFGHFMMHQIPLLEEWGSLEFRSGYGHWVGHSTFGRVLGVMK